MTSTWTAWAAISPEGSIIQISIKNSKVAVKHWVEDVCSSNPLFGAPELDEVEFAKWRIIPIIIKEAEVEWKEKA